MEQTKNNGSLGSKHQNPRWLDSVGWPVTSWAVGWWFLVYRIRWEWWEKKQQVVAILELKATYGFFLEDDLEFTQFVQWFSWKSPFYFFVPGFPARISHCHVWLLEGLLDGWPIYYNSLHFMDQILHFTQVMWVSNPVGFKYPPCLDECEPSIIFLSHPTVPVGK